MKKIIFIFCNLILISCNLKSQKKDIAEKEYIVKIEMYLDAFGVESDGFPSINAYIDFEKDSSRCQKSFYNPAYKRSTYTIVKEEMKEIVELMDISEVKKMKNEYTRNTPKYTIMDLPTSTTTIYTSKNQFTIIDYGLVGESPLQELYKIVYKY